MHLQLRGLRELYLGGKQMHHAVFEQTRYSIHCGLDSLRVQFYVKRISLIFRRQRYAISLHYLEPFFFPNHCNIPLSHRDICFFLSLFSAQRVFIGISLIGQKNGGWRFAAAFVRWDLEPGIFWLKKICYRSISALRTFRYLQKRLH